MAKARQILAEIKKYKDTKSGRILIFTGARQVGKTTLVKDQLQDYTYLSIEDPVMRSSYAALTAAQWRALYPKAALDEVQKEPQLIESIKSAYDQFDDVSYLLLGSSQILLLSKVKESLAGRCVIFDMFPLVAPELRTDSWDSEITPSNWQQVLKKEIEPTEMLPSLNVDPLMAQKTAAWDHLVRFGGYPALSDDSMTDDMRHRWLEGYVRTYLERDVRDLAALRDLEPFTMLQRSLAARTGQIFNASDVARDIKVTSKTALRYLQYLNLSYQTITLPAWSRNINKRLAKSPKIHFLDSGVIQAVLQKRGGITGNEFESVVVAEIYKQAKNIFAACEFYHFRTQDGMEVDLLVETEKGYYAFEVKAAKNVVKNDAKHLLKVEAYLDKPMLHGFIVSNDPTTKKITEKVTAISAALLLG